MHTFQPYPIDLLEWNPITKVAQEGVAIVAEAGGKVNATSSHNGGVVIFGVKMLFLLFYETLATLRNY